MIPTLQDVATGQLKLNPTLEIRERFEHRVNKDFNPAVRDARADAFRRLRPGIEFSYGKKISGAVQYQYSHDLIWSPAANFSTENSDLGLGYLRYSASGWNVVAGRQRFAIGSERLFGPLDWLNVPRSFDGIHIFDKNWDAFAVAVGVSSPRLHYANVWGAAYKSEIGQTAYYYKHDETTPGDVDIHTVSHHWQRALNNTFDADIELAGQWGKNLGKDQEAWAAHARLTGKATKSSKFWVEVNAASGGSSATKNTTFDNLYPTNHKFYGSADMFAWKNMNEFAFGIESIIDAKTDLKLHYHLFGLRDAKDAWYGAGGAPNKRAGGGTFKDPTGLSGRNVGSEIDIEGVHRISTSTTLIAGFAFFTPGRFVTSMNGGNSATQTWYYCGFQFKY